MAEPDSIRVRFTRAEKIGGKRYDAGDVRDLSRTAAEAAIKAGAAIPVGGQVYNIPDREAAVLLKVKL